jgi:hypothetical protein
MPLPAFVTVASHEGHRSLQEAGSGGTEDWWQTERASKSALTIFGIDAASRVLLLATVAVEHGLIFMLEPTSAVRDWTLDSLRRGERVPTCAADLPEPPNDL